ncbi:hypothetical protein L2E82_19907 [Cichorium intybus]|uniref:Uncharacterized protein n=1 Tax=Cichorium intybus TaxID=13427 RepID=A0ACB9DS61_CICIN|nr:hypothetical protein L2E82_19907 [Cichorium intybus]
MILMAYLSYITAEVFKLSGILTVFFCGIVMSHYAWHNVTTNSQVTTKHTFATMSYIAEVFIFLYVGMDSLDVEKWRLIDSPRKSISASAILLGLIMVGRAVFVLFLSCLSNLIRNDEHGQIKIKQQVTIWWAGLMRGAVSVALAYKKPVNAHLITSTISIVLFSTVVFGLLTKPFIRWLRPHQTEATILLLVEAERQNYVTPGLRMLLGSPTSMVHHYWRKFDDSYMRPIFGGTGCNSLR